MKKLTIHPLAYLRAVWSLLWTAFAHPFKTTVIDLETGRVVRMERFSIILTQQPEGGYSVEVPELPGCFTEGETLNNALDNAKEAIALYLQEGTRQ